MNIKKYFDMTSEKQFIYLENLVIKNIPYSCYEIEEAYKLADKELKVIKENNWSIDFLIAYEISKYIQKRIDYINYFFGIGASSAIAYMLGITGEELEPKMNGFIFEKDFYKSNVGIYARFGFYVNSSLSNEIFNIVKCQIKKSRLDFEGERYILAIGNVNIAFYFDINTFQRYYCRLEEFASLDKFATFDEDYLNILHFGLSYSYEDSLGFLRKCRDNQLTETDKNIFFSRCNKRLSLDEKNSFFNQIKKNVTKDFSKTIYVASRLILNEYYPF